MLAHLKIGIMQLWQWSPVIIFHLLQHFPRFFLLASLYNFYPRIYIFYPPILKYHCYISNFHCTQWPKWSSMRRRKQRNAIDCLVDGRGDLHATLPYCHIAILLHCQESRSWWQESGGMMIPGKEGHARVGRVTAPSGRWKGTRHIAIYHTRREVADDW